MFDVQALHLNVPQRTLIDGFSFVASGFARVFRGLQDDEILSSMVYRAINALQKIDLIRRGMMCSIDLTTRSWSTWLH